MSTPAASRVRIPREVLERAFWPDRECKVRITGARFDSVTMSVVLTVEGDGLPEGMLSVRTETWTKTEFQPA